MIKAVQDKSELEFLGSSPFSAVITSLFNTFGTGTNFAKFYVQGKNAAMSGVDGNFNIYADENADFEEIAEFLSFGGFASVKGEKEVIEKLGLDISDSSYTVRYIGEKAVKPVGFVDSFDPHKLYELLKSVGFAKGDYGSFASDVCLRFNKGTAVFGGISEDGKLLTCCLNLFKGDKSNLIGALATSEKARGRGLASAIVPYMAQSDKPSYLFCRVDSLAEFYKNCGFEVCGKWAICEKTADFNIYGGTI